MTRRDRLRVRVRLASPADTPAVLAFTRNTWGGRDYLPEVWDSWLAARDGFVMVGELADPAAGVDGAIAVARVALLAPGEAWMEGLRVDPRVHRHGVATVFQLAELAWAQAQGASIVRYATGEMNEASLRLGARHGFSPAGRWRALRPTVLDRGTTKAMPDPRSRILGRLSAGGHTVGPAAQIGALWERLLADQTFVDGQRLYEWRPWAWQGLTAERLARHAERGELLQVTEGESWALGLLARERLPGEQRLALLGGDVEPALRLVREVATAGGRPPTLRLPESSTLLAGIAPRLHEEGWSTGDHALVLMSRPLADGTGRPLPLPEDGTDRLEFAETPHPLGLGPADS